VASPARSPVLLPPKIALVGFQQTVWIVEILPMQENLLGCLLSGWNHVGQDVEDLPLVPEDALTGLDDDFPATEDGL
jgi:hypothetical protein